MNANHVFLIKNQNHPQSLRVIPFQESKSNSPSRIHQRNQPPSGNIYTSTQFFRNILNKSVPEHSSPNGKQNHSLNNLIKLTDANFRSEQLVRVQAVVPSPQKSSHNKKECSFSIQSPKKKEGQDQQKVSFQPLRKSPSQGRFQKRPSLYTEGKVNMNKFKLFYKAIMHLRISEEQIDRMWQQFEQSVDNPFKFDQLIETIGREKRAEQEKKCISNIITAFNPNNQQENTHSLLDNQLNCKDKNRVDRLHKSAEKCINTNEKVLKVRNLNRIVSLPPRTSYIKKLTAAQIISKNKLRIKNIRSILAYGTNFLKRK